MPASCVAFGCSNTYATPGTSFHSFPKCEKLKRRWVLATKRANWWPSRTSLLCSAHFNSEDFIRDPNIVDQFPRTARLTRRLKPDAVPSIFSHTKRPSKPRGAFEKRRRQEIINSLLADHQPSQHSVRLSEDTSGTSLIPKQSDDSADAKSVISAPPPIETASKKVQVNLPKVPVANKFTLTSILLRNWGVQTQEPPTLVKPGPLRRRKRTRRPALWWLAPYL